MRPEQKGDSLAQALPRTIVIDRPEAYIASDRRLALAAGIELPSRASGGVLFADVSGFTALAEGLAGEYGGHRASEELTAHLNRIFHAVIEEVDRFGGSVIYFSGDAITCWYDGDTGIRAVTSAFAMIDAIAREGRIDIGSSTIQLEMKVAVAVGDARRFVVGDPEILLLDVLAGAPLDRIAAAEQVANRGEVVIDEAARLNIGEAVVIGDRRVDELGGDVSVVTELVTPAAPSPLGPPVRELEPEEVRPWLLKSVYERLSEGRGEFLAELRPALPMFLRFGGIDFESDDAAERLDAFVRDAQRVLARFGGNVLQITLGDKGAYLYAIFGAPLAHEDDAARAVSAAGELRTLGGVSDIQIGITRGRLRSGTYGHEFRRTYCCLGDAVNLAARLMSSATPGQILVDERARGTAGDAFAWEPLEPLKLKGKRKPVRVFSLQGSTLRQVRLEARYELPMIGRHQELAAVSRALAETAQGRGRAIGVVAEPGVGKSRLLAQAAHDAVDAGASVLAGECQAFGTNTSYFVWRPIWRSLLGADAGIAAVERALAAIDPALVPRLPVLAPLIGIPIPDNDLTRTFDAKLRKESLESLAAQCLRALARDRTLVFVLEDCHWLDPLSDDLLLALAREAPRLSIALLLAYRPPADGEPGPRASTLPSFVEVPLTELDRDDAAQLVQTRFTKLYGDERDVPHQVVDLVTERAQGNPFYIEELLSFIRDSGVDPYDRIAVRDLELPDSLHSMILSRIDTLDEQPRRTLKVASVVGRVFRLRTVAGVYPELGTQEQLRHNLEQLRTVQMVMPDDDAGESFVFRHVITQQVAYESIPFATREDLHERVGGFIESTEPSLDRHLNLLAHHYSLSANDDKKREFLGRAADAAQSEYANEVAIEWYGKLVPLLDQDVRRSMLLKLGKVLEHVGRWDEAESAYATSFELAAVASDRDALAWAETALAEVARKRGMYDQASERFERARGIFEELGDLEGQGLVLHLAGTLAAQRGDYDASRESYEASLAIRQQVDDKASIGGLYSNLAIIAEYVGDLEAARTLNERGVAVRMEAGDRWGTGVSLNNLGNIARLQGNFEEARARLEDALRLQLEVGDRWMIANVQNNLANVLREQGDIPGAAGLYAEALQTYGDIGDSWALAFLFEDAAVLAGAVGDAETAFLLLGAAEARRTEIGTPRSPTDEEKLDDALGGIRDGLSAEEIERAIGSGRDLPAAEAVVAARQLCDSVLAPA
jgi:class 3 adenylate cyclase/tetratricopeptide (TPR) repeat protein